MVARISRRSLLKSAAAAISGLALGACQPQVLVQTVEVEKVVKETVVVTEEKVIKEAVEVEKEVTRVVEKEVVKAPTRGPKITFWWDNTFMEPYNAYVKDSAQITALEGNFELDWVELPQATIGQKLMVAAEAGTLPDVAEAQVSLFHAQGRLLDLTDLIAEIGPTGGGFYEGLLQVSTIDDRVWAVPWTSSAQFMYYRTDIFNAAGFDVPFKSMDEMLEACLAVTDVAKRIWGIGLALSVVGDNMSAFSPFQHAFGAHLQDENGNPDVNTPEMIKAANFYVDLHRKHHVMPPGVLGWDNTGNNKAYLSGQAAAVFNTGSIVKAMREEDPGWLEDTFLGPWPDGGNGPATQIDSQEFGIFNSCKYPDYAGKIIKGMMSPERYMGALKAAGSYFFPVMSDYSKDPFFTDDTWNKQIADALQYGFTQKADGPVSSWADEALSRLLPAEMISRIAGDGVPTEQAVAELQEELEKIVAKYETV